MARYFNTNLIREKITKVEEKISFFEHKKYELQRRLREAEMHNGAMRAKKIPPAKYRWKCNDCNETLRTWEAKIEYCFLCDSKNVTLIETMSSRRANQLDRESGIRRWGRT